MKEESDKLASILDMGISGGGKTSTDAEAENTLYRVVIFPVEAKPHSQTFNRKDDEKSFAKFQSIVGGHVERVRITDPNVNQILRPYGVSYENPIALVNEDGLPLKLPRNKNLPYFVGNVIIMEDDDLK